MLFSHEGDAVKAKDHLELNQACEGQQEGLIQAYGQQKKDQGQGKPPVQWAKGLETKDKEKAKILSAFFALVFVDEIYLQECKVLETVVMCGARAT